MTIRPKVIALFASMFVVLGIVQIFVEQRVFMPSFADLEHDDARTAMRRINYAFDLTLDRLALSAADWGNWDDTYRFVADHNPDYVRANVTTVGLRQLQVNALLVIDLDGNIVMSSALDLNSDQPLDIDFTARKALPADFPWRADLREGRPAKGFLQTNRGIMMIAASPVLDGNGRGPQRGRVLCFRIRRTPRPSRPRARRPEAPQAKLRGTFRRHIKCAPLRMSGRSVRTTKGCQLQPVGANGDNG